MRLGARGPGYEARSQGGLGMRLGARGPGYEAGSQGAWV